MSLETLFDTVLPMDGAVLCNAPAVFILSALAGLAVGFVVCHALEGGEQ